MSLLINTLIEAGDRDVADEFVPVAGVAVPSSTLRTAKAPCDFSSEILMYICF